MSRVHPEQGLLPTREWLRHAHASWTHKAAQALDDFHAANTAAMAYRRLFEVHYPGEDLVPGGGDMRAALIVTVGGATATPRPPRRTIADAAERALDAHGSALSAAVIMEAVREDGFVVHAKNRNSAISSVVSAIMRDTRNRFVRASTGTNCWALAAWGGDRRPDKT